MLTKTGTNLQKLTGTRVGQVGQLGQMLKSQLSFVDKLIEVKKVKKASFFECV